MATLNNKNELMESTSPKTRYPFYIKAPLVLIGICCFIYILYLLQSILVPFLFAGLIAILLNPLCNKLQSVGVPKVLSILLTILLALIVAGLVFFFLSSQISQFGEMVPQLKERFFQIADDVQQWLSQRLGISLKKQSELLKKVIDNGQGFVGQTLGAVLSMISVIFLLPVYVFLLLLYKNHLLAFFYQVFSEKHSEKVAEVLQSTKGAIQSYIVGLLIETCIVGILNSTALLLIGVKYAILLGVIGAILNLVPYIGGVVAISLPVLIATVTNNDFQKPLIIIGAYILIQFIDNNVLVPRIVSSKVSINALFSILIVLMGAALWGVSGMFLSIPSIAILKIIFDNIDGLKPWGRLLGDEQEKKQNAK
jgi:predicted PurR-regulated permease PerM